MDYHLVDKITFHLYTSIYNDDSDTEDYDDNDMNIEMRMSKVSGYLLKENENHNGLIMFHYCDVKYDKKMCCCVVSSDKYEKTLETVKMKKNVYHTIVNNYVNMNEGRMLLFDTVNHLMNGVPSKTYMRGEMATYHKRKNTVCRLNSKNNKTLFLLR
jgi:hypothetical protein